MGSWSRSRTSPLTYRSTSSTPANWKDDRNRYQAFEQDDVEALPQEVFEAIRHDVAKSNVIKAVVRPDLSTIMLAFGGVCITYVCYQRYPIRSTVQAFIGLSFFVITWVCSTWLKICLARRSRSPGSTTSWVGYSRSYNSVLRVATAVVLWWLVISIYPQSEPALPDLDQDHKYFIAANLHNNEAILPSFTTGLSSLIQHISPEKIFISIFESNSHDRTKDLLSEFRGKLDAMGVRNRIMLGESGYRPAWPYATSPKRIQYLADVRNKAIEPLQSSDPSVRLTDWQSYTKVLFLNDILFDWRDIVRLIGTRIEGHEEEDYDLACGLDFGTIDLYDSWVVRDICGSPFDQGWPFVRDKPSRRSVYEMKSFPVASCWNGAAVFDANLVKYGSELAALLPAQSSLHRRGWRMIDDASDPYAEMSPPLEIPIRFRPSGIEACDHSESFLFSYDIHRLYANTEGRPRILMNPAVQVAYTEQWYHWNTIILRHPVVQMWRTIWSQHIAYWLFKRPLDMLPQTRDYCTWAALKIPGADRCPPLPGPTFRFWWQ